MRSDLAVLEPEEVIDTFINGSHAGHLSYEEHSQLLDEIVDQFNDVVFPFKFGETYEGRPLIAFLIMEVEDNKRGSVEEME